MKKIKSIYILFVFAAISSYGLWACTNTGTSEATSNADSTQVEEVEEPDTRPASAAIDTNFYIKATINGNEYNFNYLSLDGKDSYNLMKNNLFRIERCADDHCKQMFYLQAHNFDLNQTPPFTLTETQEGEMRKEIIVNFILTNNQGKFKNQWKDAETFEMTINKIEGDIYEGTFKGKVQELNAKDQTASQDITGSFRTKMIIKKPTA
ncbi:MAG: hypothetical protein COZ18_08610 [Flexibacter sp. CG_4_10_14_3_um_filter_32_15]|nr:MAG: hypothetical protein COZ18_08610 [Flexibacter sp. CG_4_10_14_3_um_filter_32_15]